MCMYSAPSAPSQLGTFDVPKVFLFGGSVPCMPSGRQIDMHSTLYVPTSRHSAGFRLLEKRGSGDELKDSAMEITVDRGAREAVFLHDEGPAGGNAVARVQVPDLAAQCHILIQAHVPVSLDARRLRRLRRLDPRVLLYGRTNELRAEIDLNWGW